MDLEGQTIVATFSDFADQSNAVFMSCNDTIVLVTAVMSKEKATTDYFNLTVDYLEKVYEKGR